VLDVVRVGSLAPGLEHRVQHMRRATEHDGQSNLQGRASVQQHGDCCEQEAAQQRMRERKIKQKKKEDAKKRAEEERLMKEKEDEVQRDQINGDSDKIAAKIKKKYMKKLNAARAEIDDLHEEFQVEREELLESVREANKDAELFRQICISLLGETKLSKLIDKSRYDSDDEEWIIPLVKKKEGDEKLPGIASHNHASDYASNQIQSSNNSRQNSAGPDSGQRRRKGSMDGQEKESFLPIAGYGSERRDDKQYDNSSHSSSQIPALNLPNHAPSKPPIAAKNSGRRDKKKSKNENNKLDLSSAQDESGSGVQAGQLLDWGFSNVGLQNGGDVHGEVEVDQSLALNHMGGQSMGDRQSSRHGSRQGSRKSGRKSAGQKRKSQNAPPSDDGNGSLESFSSSCSPRSQGVNFPKL